MKRPHEQLAEDLMSAGLADMSFAAREYRYHRLRSPLPSPFAMLAQELHDQWKATKDIQKKDEIFSIYKRHMNGEYDATSEEGKESELWRGNGKGED